MEKLFRGSPRVPTLSHSWLNPSLLFVASPRVFFPSWTGRGVRSLPRPRFTVSDTSSMLFWTHSLSGMLYMCVIVAIKAERCTKPL